MRFSLCVCFVAFGCAPGGDPGSGPHGSTNGTTGGPTPSSKPGPTTPDGGDVYVPPSCGMQTFAIGLNQAAPNVMMVIDKSGSMKDPLSAGSTEAKWDALKMAVSSLLTSYQGKVRWGATVFPDMAPGADKCAEGQVQIPLGDDRTMAINSLLAPIQASTLAGATPTETTLQNVQKSAGLTDATHNNYVLLMTDGLPTCNQDGKVTPVIAALYAATPSVRTFVVGIGDGTTSDPTQLNAWADAGHTARANATTKYYQANNITDLQAAFAEIVSGIASCTYQLDMKPPDPSLLVAEVDGVAIPTDPMNGATYDPGSQSITFHGTTCDRVKSGAAKKVDLVYGCPSPPVQ